MMHDSGHVLCVLPLVYFDYVVMFTSHSNLVM